MDNLKKILMKIPLLLTLVLTSLVLSLVAYAGKDRGYRDYEVDPAQEPFLSVVLTGLHDHVYPWTDPDRKTEKEDPAPEAEAEAEEKGEEKEGREETASPEGEGTSENAEPSGEETSAEEGETEEKPSEGQEGQGEGVREEDIHLRVRVLLHLLQEQLLVLHLQALQRRAGKIQEERGGDRPAVSRAAGQRDQPLGPHDG